MQSSSPVDGIQIFSDIERFTAAVPGDDIVLDFPSLLKLTTSFVESSEKHLIIKLIDYETEDPNNLLYLTADKPLLYSKHPPKVGVSQRIQKSV